MTAPFSYTSTFTLDKSYYSECFDESVNQVHSIKTYTKAILFGLAGCALLLTAANNYASWFIIALGVLEALSIKFKRPWWLLRQMWSRAAGNDVTLTIDDTGIHTQSDYINTLIEWQQVYRINETDKGFLIIVAKGKNYLSKRYLDDSATDFIRSKI
ncbi:YcxB family protein [Shewanella sp. Isolate11]|nr:YcxB family protein [Shewanella sp. Isolate11]MCG9695834.1 YcxB family protein [Shewanella sp. Isolate11]